MNRLKFLLATIVVGVLTFGIYSCTKERHIESLDLINLDDTFKPQCDINQNIDTTLHVKIALMAKYVYEDSTFNMKIQQFGSLQDPTEDEFYKIINFGGLRLTREEVTYLNSLNSNETELFYKEVEEQFNCLNRNSPLSLEFRASLWRTMWRVGSSAVAVGVGCATGAGCILAGLYAVDQLSDAFCDFHPEKC